MAAKKDGATATYRVLRDCPVGNAGDAVELTDEEAATLIRDGMVTPKEA